MSEGVVQAGPGGPLSPEEIKRQITLIREVMDAVMRDGEHYGKIPGCGDKPSLLQPGAQVLALTFRLAPSFTIDERDLDDGHREYLSRCALVSLATGEQAGMGVGLCSTMESKFRYRNVSDYTLTGETIPEDARERKQEYRKQGFGMKKIDGVWEWVRYGDSARVENPDIADTYNTVLKRAVKRSFVAAVLNTLAASDIFSQDAEDMTDAGAALVEQETLREIRELRKALKITDALYREQMRIAQGVAVSRDTDLTRDAGARLLAAYRRRTQQEGAIQDDAEAGQTEVQP